MRLSKQDKKNILNFYTKAFSYFKRFPVLNNGCVAKANHSGLCSFLACREKEYFGVTSLAGNISPIYNLLTNDIKQTLRDLSRPTLSNLNNHYYVYFPTKEARLDYIKTNITKYQKMVDKLK